MPKIVRQRKKDIRGKIIVRRHANLAEEEETRKLVKEEVEEYVL